jgi:hypothetical protein
MPLTYAVQPPLKNERQEETMPIIEGKLFIYQNLLLAAGNEEVNLEVGIRDSY